MYILPQRLIAYHSLQIYSLFPRIQQLKLRHKLDVTMDYSLLLLVYFTPPPQLIYMLLVGRDEATKQKNVPPYSLYIFTYVLNIDKIRADSRRL